MKALGISFAGVVVGLSLSGIAMSAEIKPHTPVFKVLYHFTGDGASGGRAPQAALIVDSKNNLYGTTIVGGNGSGCGAQHCGTLFRLAPPASTVKPWTYTVLHHFAGSTGSLPFASLLRDKSGALYGTTNVGAGSGTVFKLTPPTKTAGWVYSVVHKFAGGSKDGAFPLGEVIADHNGVLYGTTSEGGTYGKGVVFRLTPPTKTVKVWSLTVLYNFSTTSGFDPRNGLKQTGDGVFYGSTQDGGLHNVGTVYSLAPLPGTATVPWRLSVLRNFVGPYTDGEFGGASLMQSGGYLYGTTIEGGTENVGTIFSYRLPTNAQPTGSYKVRHSFVDTEGTQVYSNLVADKSGYLYGVASSGGANGDGTVFRFKPSSDGLSGTMTVLHHFVEASEGGTPLGGLVLSADGVLYGTTSTGGAHDAGTIFSIKP